MLALHLILAFISTTVVATATVTSSSAATTAFLTPSRQQHSKCTPTRHGQSNLLVSSSSTLFSSTVVYEEPVFRPPAEWRSLILQVTIGCSWNRCSFCEMYQTKTFRVKSIEDIEEELESVAQFRGRTTVRDVFLADGEAMTLPTKQLVQILDTIRYYFPNVRRISSYCLPRNIYRKSVPELTLLKEKGLSLVYVGCESGSDAVLDAIDKGETYETSLRELDKLQQAGIKRSIMILLGLGGTRYSREHAMVSAKLASDSQPEFLSVLTTSFPRGMARVEAGYQKHLESLGLVDDDDDNNQDPAFTPLTARESLEELQVFLEHMDMETNRTVFRSDHASNYLVLKGRLGRDQTKLIEQLTAVLEVPVEEDVYNLRPEWARGL